MTQPPSGYNADPAVLAALDSERMRRVLQSHFRWPDVLPADVPLERLWPERRGGFTFEWSVALGTKQYRLYGRSGVTDNAARRFRGVRVTPECVRGALAYVPEWRLRLQSPDCDPDLPQLAKCLDSSEVGPLLAPQWRLNGSADHGDARLSCRVLSYRPGRRAALAYIRQDKESGAQRVLGKLYRDRRGQQLFHMHRILDEQLRRRSDGRFRVPAARAYLDPVRMLLLEWGGAAEAPRPPVATARAGAALLGALHSVTLSELAPFTREMECDVLARWYRMMQTFDPQSASRTGALYHALTDWARSVPQGPIGAIHRDFYEKQFGARGPIITLFDLDTLSCGETALDLGNFLAHLYLMCRRVPGMALLPAATGAAIERYASSGRPLSRDALAFYWATASFRVGAIHTFRASTRRLSPAMWELSAAIVGESTGGAPPVEMSRRCRRLARAATAVLQGVPT